MPRVPDLPLAALRALIEHDDPDTRRLGLVRLAERQGVEEDGFAWAGVLPEEVDASPEAALAQARIHLRLRLGALPGWRAAREVPVRVAWLAAELASRPEAVREEPAGELLYQAVREIGVRDARDPEALVRELAARDDAVLREEAFRVAREALRAALLAPARALPLIADLATGADGVGGAVRELAEPWAALDPLPRHRVLPLLDGRCPEAAVDVAARHGHPDLLRDVAADPGRPPRARRRALEAYGDLADRGDVPGLLRIAAADPLLLAGPALRCLRGMHRRGRFPADDHVPAIVGLALADHGIGADGFAAVVFSSRRAVVRELTAATGADDASWPRRLELLVALDAQGAGELGIGDAVAASARSADDPRPFLRALRALRHVPAEQAVIDLLPRAPREALDALEAIGGPRTVAALRDGLGADGGTVEHLRPFASRALEVLWHLTEDAGERRSLLARLDPRSVPPRIADDLGGPDAAELAFLRADLDPDDPAEALCRIARNGDASTVPAVADLLLRVVSDLAAAWRSGPEPSVPDAARAAVRDLGARLFRRGAVRPRCLLDADGPEPAGNALLASTVLDLTARPGLTATELAILLGLLRDVPYRRIKARVHPLLRHRDPDVRKHVIALLADDAEDLSASLVPLASGDDARTVRQAVRALAEARATWAAPVIAACLDHPNMNVKKTAADALARAGAPSAVPKLLHWLGAHDNPGFRESLTGALRAVLGDAYAATVLAAADRAATERSRDLLLRAVVLTPRSIAALAGQGSPSGAALLAAAPGRSAPPDADLCTLTTRGWDEEAARRVVRAHDPATPPDPRLRPLLARFLDLPGALRFALRLCPPPWKDEEAAAFARHAVRLAEALPDGFDGPDEPERQRALDALLRAIPFLTTGERLALIGRLRSLPLARPGIALLRACGAVLTRADLDRALAAAANGPDPWLAEEAVLREAFALPASPLPSSPLPAREEGSRERLNALIDAYRTAGREETLARMTELQPLGAPPWTIAEDAARPVPAPRVPSAADLDQPRSSAQRERLLAMLDDPVPSRRETAARTLLAWPEPEPRLAVLHAHLAGRVTVPAHDLAPALVLAEPVPKDDASLGRLAGLASHLTGSDLERLVPLLLRAWERDPTGPARHALDRVPRDVLAAALTERLEAGAWGVLDLLKGARLTRTPALTRTLQRLRDEGRAEPFTLVDGPLHTPDTAAALAALRTRTPPPRPPSRAELFRRAREGTVEEIRRALTALAERPSDALADLLAESVTHPEARVRLHAHRLSRRVLDRPAYLDQTVRLLDDPRPDIVRSAAATLGHAAWEPAVPGLVTLLAHPRPAVRDAAAEALVRIGAPAAPALKHAAARARPDRRPRYTTVLERITAGQPPAPGHS